MKVAEKKKKLTAAIESLEVAEAIQILSYHDKNYLCRQLAFNPARQNETIRMLIDRAKRKCEAVSYAL